MKKLCIITCWFEWTWGWRIASILENSLSENYKTTTLIWFYDKGIYPIKWKKLYLGKFWKKEFPLRWWIALIPHIVNTIRYLHKEQPDVVMSIWSYCNFLWLIAQKFLKFKLLLTQHEHITSKLKNGASMMEKMIFSLNKELIWSTKIVCVSKNVMEDTIKFYRISDNQAITIYNWLDIDKILKLSKEKIDVKEKYIITIGTLDGNKNQELIIRAYNESKIKWDYSLYILWEGEKREYLSNLIKALKLEWKVKLLWYQKNPYKYLANASLFCFASKSEALPTVLIECLILQIPILTVPVTGSDEILDNWKFWIITKDWDVDIFWKMIEHCINNNDSEMINKWYDYVKNNFSVKKMIKQYEHSINSL